MDSLISLLSPSLAIVGWGIAYRLAKVNSTRTESKSLIDSCNTLIDTLAEKGSEFYLSPTSTKGQQRNFEKYALNKISLLFKKLELLDKRGVTTKQEMISDFHMALTEGIPTHGLKQEEDDNCAHKIMSESAKISYNLHSQFHVKYPPIEGFISFKRYFWKH